MNRVSVSVFLILVSSGVHADWQASVSSSSCAIREHLAPTEAYGPRFFVGFSYARESEATSLPNAKAGELLFYVLHFGPRAEGAALAESVTFDGHQLSVLAKDQEGTWFAIGMPESGELFRQLKNGHAPRLAYKLSDTRQGTVLVKTQGFSSVIEPFRSCGPAT